MSHDPLKTSARFDDPNIVSRAGLVPVMSLAERAWTPGGRIVFLRQIGAPTQTRTSAYIVNPDGSGLRLLYPNLNAVQITWGSTTLPKPTC